MFAAAIGEISAFPRQMGPFFSVYRQFSSTNSRKLIDTEPQKTKVIPSTRLSKGNSGYALETSSGFFE
jgi:hypothetical protein